MKRVFVDTNVFVRFLTQDDEGQAEEAERLLRAAASGQLELVTGPPVPFELAWTLRRAYGVPRKRCLDVLSSLLALEGLVLTDRDLLTAAIERARTHGGELADAYIAVSAEATGAAGVATFNRKDFERLAATVVDWSEP